MNLFWQRRCKNSKKLSPSITCSWSLHMAKLQSSQSTITDIISRTNCCKILLVGPWIAGMQKRCTLILRATWHYAQNPWPQTVPGFQKSVLKRLLNMQLNHLSDQRFEPHLQSPFALWPQLSEILGVQSLVSKKMRNAGGFQFGSDDILLGIHGNNGFKIDGFLQIDSVLCILSTELEVISRDLLRSRWKRTGKAHLLFLTDLSKFVVPYWWQEASNELLCLH